MSFSIKSLVHELLYEPAENGVGDIDHEYDAPTPTAEPCQDLRPSLFEVIALDEFQFPALHSGVQYWQQLCGKRRFPRREELNPRRMAKLLRHTAVIKVLAGGGDYEYRIVGDAISRAYHLPLQHHRLSDFEAAAPTTVQSIRGLFGNVVDSRMPLAVRRRTGHDAPEAIFTEAETIFLPLGVSETAVDHLLVFSFYLLGSAKL